MQPNKAIVGRNAFAHESGIHQDGVIKERTTYEIMDATSVGLDANSLVLGKHSGRAALKQTLAELGFTVEGAALNMAFKRFKEIADKKKQVTAMDLEALVTDDLRNELASYTFDIFMVDGRLGPRAARDGHRDLPDGVAARATGTGDGPIDSVFAAINAATGMDAQLRVFRVDSVTGGQDALGESSVVLEYEGQSASGQGVATDIIEAAGTGLRARALERRAQGTGGERGRSTSARTSRSRRRSRRPPWPLTPATRRDRDQRPAQVLRRLEAVRGVSLRVRGARSSPSSGPTARARRRRSRSSRAFAVATAARCACSASIPSTATATGARGSGSSCRRAGRRPNLTVRETLELWSAYYPHPQPVPRRSPRRPGGEGRRARRRGCRAASAGAWTSGWR